MKRKNICAEAALREVARKNHTTVEEVRKEIRLAMIAAMCNGITHFHSGSIRSFAYSIVIACS